MRVTKAQAEENRKRIIDTASALFRERGYDGIGVSDLMAAAGFTHGGFYRHFRSKAALMAETAADGLHQIATRAAGMDTAGFVHSYVSREHRDAAADGCNMPALAADAARQPEEVRAAFDVGIGEMIATLEYKLGDPDDPQTRVRAIGMLAQAVGAIALSRACPDDSALADEILDACSTAMLTQTETAAPRHG